MLDKTIDLITPFREAVERAISDYQERIKAFSYPSAQNDDIMAPAEAITMLKAFRLLPREQRQILTDIIQQLSPRMSETAF
ncbi:hypothetical protein [Rhizobium sp. FKY42]|uniref:hypothetical protein n=1 Tax=Rhizobium sp. FKY42 TaxID=2562310 RepID=UPI0010C0DA29|nr:hypothetical protein [Rhizobium sp. FKY42]